MIFKKNVLLIVTSLSLPTGMLAIDNDILSGKSVLIHIDQKKVFKAEQACQEELQYAKPVQWGIGLSVATVVGLCAYKYYWRSTTPSVQKLSDMCHEQQKTIALLQEQVALLAANKQLEAPAHSWGYRATSTAWDIGMMLFNSGALSLGSEILLTPVVNKIRDVKNSLPNSGDLQWYINNRVPDYATNLSTLMRCVKYEMFRPTLNLTLASWIGDIEKILGYISCFANNLEQGELLAQSRCSQYVKDIELLANQLVDDAAKSEDLTTLTTRVSEVHGMIMSAKDFIATRYR